MKKLLALALLAALLVTVRVAPEAEAAGRKAVLDTAYVCDFGQGSGVIDVTVKVRLPRKAAAGSTLAQRRIKVSLVLPADTVASLRQFGVESVEGRADRARLRVGPARPAVRGLRVPRTDLPESGSLVLRGTGRVDAFATPAPGRYAVKVPKRLAVELTAHGDGSSFEQGLACAVAPGAPSRLGTLRVKA
ncbi:MAG: hypothetical protein CMJ44_01280 [Pimelobacter sp.]|nr:hypothetical protein [Pimelobacter sp.]